MHWRGCVREQCFPCFLLAERRKPCFRSFLFYEDEIMAICLSTVSSVVGFVVTTCVLLYLVLDFRFLHIIFKIENSEMHVEKEMCKYFRWETLVTHFPKVLILKDLLMILTPEGLWFLIFLRCISPSHWFYISCAKYVPLQWRVEVLITNDLFRRTL